MNLDFTSFAGLALSIWGLLELLKKRFAWVDGHEEVLALALPAVVGVGMKLSHWGFAADLSWMQIVSGALMAGLAAQVAHDKVPAAASSFLSTARAAGNGMARTAKAVVFGRKK